MPGRSGIGSQRLQIMLHRSSERRADALEDIQRLFEITPRLATLEVFWRKGYYYNRTCQNGQSGDNDGKSTTLEGP